MRTALDSLVRSGFVLEHTLTPSAAEPWRAFHRIRAESPENVQARLSSLESSQRLEMEIHEVEVNTRQFAELRATI